MTTLLLYLLFCVLPGLALILVKWSPRLRLVVPWAFALAFSLACASTGWATAPVTSGNATFTAVASWNVSYMVPNAGSPVPIASNTNNSATASFTQVGTGTAGSFNQIATKVYSISASSSTTIDLSAAITNVVNSSTATFARIYVIQIQLLSMAQDSVNGTACSSVTFGNASSNQFISQSGSGFLSTGTSTFDLPNGGFMGFGVANIGGVAISSSFKNLKILNNDSSNAAGVRITLIGDDT